LRNHTPRFAAQHAYFLNDSAFQETVLQPERNPRYRFVLNRIEGPEWSRMPIVLQINVALWGMLICLAIQAAGWLKAAF